MGWREGFDGASLNVYEHVNISPEQGFQEAFRRTSTNPTDEQKLHLLCGARDGAAHEYGYVTLVLVI